MFTLLSSLCFSQVFLHGHSRASHGTMFQLYNIISLFTELQLCFHLQHPSCVIHNTDCIPIHSTQAVFILSIPLCFHSPIPSTPVVSPFSAPQPSLYLQCSGCKYPHSIPAVYYHRYPFLLVAISLL